MSEINVNYPGILKDKIKMSDIYGNHTSTGKFSSYGIDLHLDEMSQFKKLKSSDMHTLQCKIETTLISWAKAYERHLVALNREKKESDVEQMNQEATSNLAGFKGILKHTLTIDDAVDWDAIKRKEPFSINSENLVDGFKPSDHFKFGKDGNPGSFEEAKIDKEPTFDQVKASYGLFARLFQGATIQKDHQKQLASWKKNVEEAKVENVQRKEQFDELRQAFEAKAKAFEEEKAADNASLEKLKVQYQNGEANAIEEYCDIVLTSSYYPDGIPRNWELEYRELPKMLLVQMDLPSPDDMPEVESYKYVKTRDEIDEKKISETARKKLYDNVVYQICLRTMQEIFEADVIEGIDSVVFNGVVTSRNVATGNMETKIIVSVSTDKQAFVNIDLANIDPKATFKHLKGVSAASLHGVTPIPPIIQLDKSDKRIIEGKEVDIDASTNLAAMDWEDFEHLVRNLFEKEFTATGGEVKVTQASSDGGVDAIAFDPDPIRGGKIVIQAKRYTNVVGVAAVRDLYGTVLNEGATKGILVTTSDYGKDSYEFIKGKPLTLLNGSNLLAMLEKHGHKAHIDTAEAKKILGQ